MQPAALHRGGASTVSATVTGRRPFQRDADTEYEIEAGLYKSNAKLDPEPESAWFQILKPEM
jgi:hypothetical protein